MFSMFLVNLLHDLKVLLTLAFRLVVMGRSAQTKNLALLLYADLAFRGYQSSAGISIPNCLDTRLANIRAGECKARFISAERRRMKPKVNPVASPDRLSCVDICPSVSQDAASSIFGVSNAAAEFSRNSFFQRLHHYW